MTTKTTLPSLARGQILDPNTMLLRQEWRQFFHDLWVKTGNGTGNITVQGTLTHTGTTVGFYSATPVAQASHIANPTGGATQDAEARTAINAILVVLENLGLTATS